MANFKVLRSLGQQVIITGKNLYQAIPRSRAKLTAAHQAKLAKFQTAGLKGLAQDTATTLICLGRSGRDLITFLSPQLIKPQANSFGFLVHPRDIKDIWTCYPLFKYLPDALVMEIAHLLPPRVLSSINGVYSQKTGKELKGYLLAAFVAPQHIIENPTFAVIRAIQTAILAKKRGLSIIGLGALLPFLTKYGTLIKKNVPGIGVTTGHAFTAQCIAQTALQVIKDIDALPGSELIAILGAAGSTGSASLWALAQKGTNNLLLIDREAKKDRLLELKQQLEDSYPDLSVKISTDNADVMQSRVIITVTNAGSSLIEEKWLKPGMIFIDDAQPPNVSQELAEKRKDILVIKVLVRIPGSTSNFDYYLGTPEDVTFTCLGEISLLASIGWQGDHTIGYANREQVEGITKLSIGSNIGLPSPLYGYEGQKITSEMIRQVGSLWQ